jgi:hypothetical protein
MKVKGKVKLSAGLIKHCGMKIYGEWRVNSTHSLFRQYMEVSGQFHSLERSIPGEGDADACWRRGWVGTTAGLTSREKRKTSRLYRTAVSRLSSL